MDAVRILSLNIWNRSGPWDARLPLICSGLSAEAADIVGLQEVLCMQGPLGTLSQLDAIVDGLRALPTPADADAGSRAKVDYPHRAYTAAWTLDSASGFTMGNAILSRFPIIETRGTLLPNPIGHETRALLYALCETPSGLLPVFVTHLDWQFELSHARCQQVAFIVDQLTDWLTSARQGGRDVLPAVLLGDFNAEPDSDEIRFLRGRHALPSARGGGLRGCYFNDVVEFCRGDAGPTFARDNVFAVKEREPDRRIDYIFTAPPDRYSRGLPLSARRCFTQAEGGIHPSDHYGVVCDLALGRPPSAR
jgi:endonuclease/exonuclease/phosphatase family metal-dependent hydrolase